MFIYLIQFSLIIVATDTNEYRVTFSEHVLHYSAANSDFTQYQG